MDERTIYWYERHQGRNRFEVEENQEFSSQHVKCQMPLEISVERWLRQFVSGVEAVYMVTDAGKLIELFMGECRIALQTVSIFSKREKKKQVIS